MYTDSERASHARKVLEHLLLANGSYHHHKEIMAHGGVALQIAMFGWIMTRDTWPPAWLGKGLAFWGILVIWFLLHIYIRWQLRLRRWAATQVDGLRRTLGRWSTLGIEPNELTAYEAGANGQSLRDYWPDLLYPCFGLTVPANSGKLNYPKGLVNDLLEADKKQNRDPGGRLLLVERLFFGASVIMLGLVVLRTLLDNGAEPIQSILYGGRSMTLDDTVKIWTLVFTALSAVAAAVGAFGILYALKTFRFNTWLKAQAIYMDKEFYEARKTVLEHFEGCNKNNPPTFTPKDKDDALIVCRKMDELARLTPYIKKEKIIETWGNPMGKSWIILEKLVDDVRTQDKNLKKWKAFQRLAEKANEKYNLE